MADLIFGSVVLSMGWILVGLLVGWIGRLIIYLTRDSQIPDIEGLIYNVTMAVMMVSIIGAIGYLASQGTPSRAWVFFGEVASVLALFVIFYPGFVVCHHVLKKSPTHQETLFEKFWFS